MDGSRCNAPTFGAARTMARERPPAWRALDLVIATSAWTFLIVDLLSCQCGVEALSARAQSDDTEAVVHIEPVVYKALTIMPVARISITGYAATAVIAHPDGRCETLDNPGYFASERAACQFAIQFAKAHLRWPEASEVTVFPFVKSAIHRLIASPRRVAFR